MKSLFIFYFISELFQAYSFIFNLTYNNFNGNTNNIQPIKEEEENNDDNYFKVTILFGDLISSQKIMNIRLHTAAHALWVPSTKSKFESEYKYDHEQSKSYKSLNYTMNVDSSINGVVSTETIKLGIKLHDFEWVLATEYTIPEVKNCNGIIGFTRKHNTPYNNRQSFIEQLKLQEKIFSIEKNGDYAIKIGMSETFEMNYDRRGHCSFGDLSDEFWKCRMSHIVFGEVSNETFKGNAVAIYKDAKFNTGKETFVFPIEYINLFNHIMNQNNSECDYDRKKEGTKIIYCNKTMNVPDLSFVFNGYSLRMNYTELFEGMKLLIKFENTDIIDIGMPFFLAFRTMFDDSAHEMGFLPNELSETDKIKNVHKYTTDDDFLFREHKGIVASVIIGLTIVFGIGLYLFVLLWKRNLNQEYVYITKLDNIIKQYNHVLFEDDI